MKGANSLTSHNGESRARRADKMGSSVSKQLGLQGVSKAFLKKFYARKNRMFLKNLKHDKI